MIAAITRAEYKTSLSGICDYVEIELITDEGEIVLPAIIIKHPAPALEQQGRATLGSLAKCAGLPCLSDMQELVGIQGRFTIDPVQNLITKVQALEVTA